jgi:transcription elongation regulator 1
VSDPRYVLLPSVSARREAFDEYCRDRARELRQSNVKKEKDWQIQRKLSSDCSRKKSKSTRTSWTDFRRTWKKIDDSGDGAGMIGSERSDLENISRIWAKVSFSSGLAMDRATNLWFTEKRAAAQKAETDFFSLLRERKLSSSDLLWKDVHAFAISGFIYDSFPSRSSAKYRMIHAMKLSALLRFVKSYSTPF